MLAALVLTLSMFVGGTLPARGDATDWDRLMSGALARTALTPGLQAPSAWAVIEPGPVKDEFTTFAGGAGGAAADTPFLIGSLSKPLTAAAVMTLVEGGRMGLDAPVSDYLPGFRPHDSDALTVAHLLSHTSGFSAEAGLDAHHDPGLSIADRAAGASSAPRDLTRTPAAFRYSNLNYAVLGAVVEAVSGMDFAGYMEQELFAPVGMPNSTADPAKAREVAAGGHIFAFGVPVSSVETVPVGAGPDGYTVSTANDVAAFLRMLLREGIADDGTRVLGAESARSLLTPHTPTLGAGSAAPGTDGYGFGWGTGGTPERPIAAHVGRTDGFFAHAQLHPADGQAVLVLQAVNGPLYDQTAPVAIAAAAFTDDGSAGIGEPAIVTVAIFVAFGLIAFAAALLVGWLRSRRDRRSPPRTPAAATRRVAVRAALDIGGGILVVVLWLLGAGLMFTGRPSLGTDPFAASVELTLICGALGAFLVGRGVTGLARYRRS